MYYIFKKWQNMNTHKVIDLMYTEEEGQDTLVGTEEECNIFVTEQDCVGLRVVPLTRDEILNN